MPAKTPGNIVNKLNTEINKALHAHRPREARQARRATDGDEYGEFDNFVNEELVINADLANAAGISAQ